MSRSALSPAMQDALARLRRYGGHFYGNHGIAEYTLDALKRRGLIRYEDRMCPTLKFERPYAVLTDAGRAAL